MSSPSHYDFDEIYLLQWKWEEKNRIRYGLCTQRNNIISTCLIFCFAPNSIFHLISKSISWYHGCKSLSYNWYFTIIKRATWWFWILDTICFTSYLIFLFVKRVCNTINSYLNSPQVSRWVDKISILTECMDLLLTKGC